MALVTIRNPESAHNRTVVATANLKSGMVVKLIQGAAKGDPCKVDNPSAADLTDATVVKGLLTYIPDDDLAMDFIINPANEALTVSTEADSNNADIPTGALCVFWYNKPVVGVHSSVVDASLVFATVREGDVVSVKEATSKLALLDVTMGSTSSHAVGVIYQHEGAELTILLHLL